MKKLEEYDWICPEPFTNLMFSAPGDIRGCCATTAVNKKDMQDKYNLKTFNSSKDTFDDYYNAPQNVRWRSALKNNDDKEFTNDICGVCKKQEKAGSRSHRQFYLSRFNDQNEFAHKKEELEKIIETDSKPTFWHTAIVNGVRGNICNLRCNFCSSGNSSQFNKEAIELGETKKRVKRAKINPQFAKDLKHIIENAEEIKFTGGEPLIGDNIYDILSVVSDRKIVRVITNGTQNVDRFIEETKRFRRVIVNVSVDGVGDFNNYIRYLSDWDVVNVNIKKLQKSPHIQTYMAATINALNAGKVHQLCEEFHYINFSPVVNNVYRIESIPPEVRDCYLDTLYENGKHDEVKKVIRFLEQAEWDHNGTIALMSHVKSRDKARGTCLLDYVPEWEKYYKILN